MYFRNSEGRWVLVRAYPGRTLANFTQQAIDLATAPNGGGSFFHSQFQVRFRSTGSASATDLFDDWFIDDVSLSVSGAAITVSQTTLVFDSTLVGGVTTSSLEVRNIGDAPVIVSDILSTNTDFSVDINSFTLGAGSRQVVNVTFQPGQPGLINGLLRIASNDVNNDTLDVAVRGRGFTPTGIGEGDVLPATFAV